MSPSRIQPAEYVARMEALGLYAPSASAPELSSAVWREYLRLYDALIAPVSSLEILWPSDGFGFYRDPLGDTEAYSFALLGPISHPVLPFRQAELMAGLERALRLLDACVVSDTFDCLTLEDPGDPRLLWLSSPRARLLETFSEYGQSLTRRHRQRMNALFARYEGDPDLEWELSAKGPSPLELGWLERNLGERWGADAPYALAQNLWPIAVSEVHPAHALFMRVYHGGKLAFLNSYVLRRDTITSQATCRDVSRFFDGLGVLIDFQTIKHLCGNRDGLRYLDPTCRATLSDPPSIGVAKRVVTNEDCPRPILLAGPTRLPFEPPHPQFHTASGWCVPESA